MKKILLIGAAAVAVAGQAGIKYWDNPEYKAFDVGDYVQDGLVVNYDGIRNVGAVADHDSSATTWVNLGSWGSDYDMPRYSLVSSTWAAGGSTGYWTGKGFVSVGSSIFHKVDQPWTLPESYSVQTLTDATSSGQGGNIGYVICPYYDNTVSGGDGDIQDGGLWQKNDWARFAVGIRKNSFTYKTSLSTSMYLCAGDDMGSRVAVQQDHYQYMTTMLDSKTNAVIFSGIAAPWSEDSNARRGKSAPSSTPWQNGTSGRTKRTFGKGVSIFGHYPRTDELFKGTLNSLRLYNKVLSDEEIAWNRVVDEARFFNRRGALPVTNIVVATTIPGIADDHFAIDEDGYTFSAPAQRTVDGKRYVLGGYTLETWNGSTWDSPVPYNGESSYTATDTSAKVRLTWQYAAASGEGRLAHYDVSDYVTDGLLLFYDGIRNAGANADHDPNATTWVNIGNGDGSQDCTLSLNRKRADGDPGDWSADGYNFKGYSEFKKEFSISHPTTHSIQVLVDADKNDQIYAIGYVYATAYDYSSITLSKNGSNPAGNMLYWCAGGNGAPIRPFIQHSDGKYDCYATAIMDGTAKTQAFTDGTTIPSSGTITNGFYQSETDFPSYNAARIFLGGYNGSSSASSAYLLVGKVKFFRYYPNKKLTEAELAQNRKVDEYRYFGRYTVTNVLVQSTYSYLEGYDKCGAYEVDGSYTFAAPATVTAPNGIEYACDGYTVETQDGIGWGNAAHYTGNSYLYTTAAGTVRLTWKWKPVSGLRTAADYSLDDLASGAILHYDGLLNQGIGAERSTTATTWVNLGILGAAGDASRTTSGSAGVGAWTDDGYGFVGGSKFLTAQQLVWTKSLTIQVLLDAAYTDNTATGDGNYVFSTGWNKGAMVLRGGDASKTMWFHTQSLGHNDMPRIANADSSKFTFGTAITDDSSKSAVVFTGTEAPTSGTIQTGYLSRSSMADAFLSNVALGGWGGESAKYLRGTVKSFRYYDRVLTEEEIVRNRNVDAVRYFGELGVTNVFVVAGGGTQAETGAYKVEGEWTFSATSVADQKRGLVVPVVRYTTETLVNGEWTNKTWHDGTNFTYSAAANLGTVRLTWKPQAVGTSVILR